MTKRSMSAGAAGKGADGGARRLRVGAFAIDLDTRELLTSDDRPVELRRKALDVLLLLAEHAGHVVDKTTLMERVWTGLVVGDDSLTQTIVEIRRAIGDADRQVLRTVAGRGYRLFADNEPQRPDDVPSFSIAVLPISSASDAPDAARCAAALTTELALRTGFDAIGSKVAARDTVAAVHAVGEDPRVAAQRLGVRQVVCGELRSAAGGWSLALEIIDGVTGARRWCRQFALTTADLPAQLDTLAARAARAVLVEMHRTAAEISAAAPAHERSASELALQGWASVYGGISPPNLLEAKRVFEQAVAKDPSHLRALVGLCIMNWWTAVLDWAPDRQEAQRQTVAIAARTEQLYPSETLTALASGAAADIEGRWELRLSIADRLCGRDPWNPTAHFARGSSLLKLGRFDESIAELEEARRLSVDDFRAAWWDAIEACAHLMAHRSARAVQAAQRAMAANACLPLSPLLLAAALAAEKRPAEAREALSAHLSRDPRCDRARAEWLLGRGDAAYQRECVSILDTLMSLGLPAPKQTAAHVSPRPKGSKQFVK
jgi:DNA-binding winged helix-turn-helix (wHTH) protein/tetratricopeptide (TPR) repeat protein